MTSGSDAKESATLDQKFLEKFVAAVQGGRCSLSAFRQAELTPTMIDPKIITVASLRLSCGVDNMEIAGAKQFGVHVVMAGQDTMSTPQLRNATDAQIHADIRAERLHAIADV